MIMGIGPAAGGLLTQHLSWSWVFFINIPIGIAAILLGSRVIPGMTARKWKPGFDRAGAILIFAGLASMLFTLTEGQTFGWTSPVIILSAFCAFLALAGFFWCELSVTDPLLEIRLFRQRNFFTTNLIIMLLFFNFSGIFFLFPFYLQYVQGHDPSAVGLIFSSFSASIMIGGVLAGTLYNRLKGRRINIVAGIMEITGYFLVTQIRAETSPWFVVFCLLLIGIGVGMILTSASNMIMNSVAKKYQGMISSFTNLERFIPMIIGITVFNILFVRKMSATGITGGLSKEVLAEIRVDDLSGCFEPAFFFAFLISIMILVCTILSRQEIHPDYLPGKER